MFPGCIPHRQPYGLGLLLVDGPTTALAKQEGNGSDEDPKEGGQSHTLGVKNLS
jgi:hypothetical protein